MTWYWRTLIVVIILSILVAFAVWIYDEGRRVAGFRSDESVREIQSLRNQLVEFDAELAVLRSLARSGESNMQIERVTQKQLSQQVKVLEVENSRLKEDLAFFEGLMPGSEAESMVGARIDHMRVEPRGALGEYSYRMLVVNNASHRSRELKGDLQILVKAKQGGNDVLISFPSGEDTNPQRFHFEIKYFHRLEGVFSVPAGAVVKEVEARLLLDGKVHATKSVKF